MPIPTIIALVAIAFLIVSLVIEAIPALLKVALIGIAVLLLLHLGLRLM